MVDTEQQQPTYRFGVFELNIRRGELRKHGVRIRLQQQPLQILCILLERPGEVVPREEIQRRLWPADTYVAFDNAINSSIRKIREALGDSAENPRYIDTLSRRGYRFIAPVSNQPSALFPASAFPSGDGFISPAASADKQVSSSRPIYHPWWRSSLAIITLFALATAVFWISRSRSNSNTPADLLSAVPFTSYPGYEVLPAFSPEGTRVAFSWQKPGSSYPEVYIKLIGAGEPVRISSAGGYGVAWSPDGRFLAYLRPIDDLHAAVVITPAVGGPERVVTRIKCFGTTVDRHGWNVPAPLLAWSLDGNWLLTLDQETGSASQPHRIVRVSADGGEKRTLTFPPLHNLGNGGLALSPNGKRLAFTEDSGFWARDIYVVPVSSDFSFIAKPERITFDHKAIAGVAWTSDSKYLIFSSPRSGSSQLWKVAAEPGSDPVRLGLTEDEVTDVAISRDGKRLMYAYAIDDQNIWRASLRDGRVTRPTNFIASTRRDTQAHYSPDGTRIVFESNRSGNEEIWACNADGSDPVQLTYFGNAWAGSPSWSPDGKQIAFGANAAGEWDIYIISADGGKPRRLTHGGADESWPTWSRDGEWIYYFSNRSKQGQIWKMRATGGPEVQITRHGAYWSSSSVDGKDLYYMGDDGLWKVPVSGGNEVKVADANYFVPAKDGLYYVDAKAEQQLSFPLFFLDFKTRERRTVGVLPGPLGWNIEVSPDSRLILYSKYDRLGSELMFVEDFR